MTVAERLPARVQHRCDICKKVGFGFKRYSSPALDETCPDQVPHVCSDDCADQLNAKLVTGQIAPPTLKADPGGFKITRPRKGY